MARHQQPGAPAGADASPELRLILRALRELAGSERGLFYDVPRAQAPVRLPGTPVFLHASPAWRRFLDARERLDDGTLTVMLALRPLAETEPLLAVDWGNSYANTFLLVEPHDPTLDLTDPANPARHALEAAARRLLHDRDPDAEPAAPWTRATPLGAALRAAYGTCLLWSAPPPAPPQPVPLHATASDQTLSDLLLQELRTRFPPEAFRQALARLYEREPELFSGRTVARARIPFLTRLGLPVPHAPHQVARALRALVNEGHAWLFERGPDARAYHGPSRGIPADMPDDEFLELVM